MMKPYTQFVNQVYDCIVDGFENSSRPLTRFAERVIRAGDLVNQDYAILRDDDALFFKSVFKENERLLEVKASERFGKQPQELSYSKVIADNDDSKEENIHWLMNETLGRKQKFFMMLNNDSVIKVAHSCYPKNIRRWLKGTISRKKENRIDFCIISWGHITGWDSGFTRRPEYYNDQQKKMLGICNEFAGTNEKILSFKLMWEASCRAYQKTFVR